MIVATRPLQGGRRRRLGCCISIRQACRATFPKHAALKHLPRSQRGQRLPCLPICLTTRAAVRSGGRGECAPRAYRDYTDYTDYLTAPTSRQANDMRTADDYSCAPLPARAATGPDANNAPYCAQPRTEPTKRANKLTDGHAATVTKLYVAENPGVRVDARDLSQTNQRTQKEAAARRGAAAPAPSEAPPLPSSPGRRSARAKRNPLRENYYLGQPRAIQ